MRSFVSSRFFLPSIHHITHTKGASSFSIDHRLTQFPSLFSTMSASSQSALSLTPLNGHQCVICHERDDTKTMAETLSCGCDKFHRSCLTEWQARSSRCPQCNTDHPENECVCGRVLTNDAREIAPCGCQKCVKCWQQSRDDEDDAFPCSICGEEDITNWLEDNYEPNYNNSLSARMQRDFQQKEVDQKQQVNMAAESFVSWFKINRTKKVSEFAEDMPPNYRKMVWVRCVFTRLVMTSRFSCGNQGAFSPTDTVSLMCLRRSTTSVDTLLSNANEKRSNR
jgi:hypothetical protein